MSRIIIVPVDTFCMVDSMGFRGVDMSSVDPSVHAVQWFDTMGWIEFLPDETGNKPENQMIADITPFKPVLDSWQLIKQQHETPVDPVPPSASTNKQIAETLLRNTDWTQIPSVSDPAMSNPYLTNADEFAAFRVIVRQHAINPTEGFIDWPATPDSVWSA